jgi:hypothetical protein
MIEDKDGKYVEYEDYARLKAEVERLTKAGDAIYQSFDQFGQVDATTLKGWQAAKEGKQS